MSLGHLESVPIPVDFSEFDEVIDVRTPLEFEEDHLPGARNLPVLNNEQRVEVGTLYKESPFKGRKLGAHYVSESIAGHLAGSLSETKPGWNPLIYCWRGGQRSTAFATVLRSIGWRARTLEGGYKAYRRFVIEGLVHKLSEPELQFRIISGLTGVGKTRLLEALRREGTQVIDLEAMANHRGSLLGSLGKQPSQRHFETLLHTALSKLDPSRPIFAEAESNRIGSLDPYAELLSHQRHAVLKRFSHLSPISAFPIIYYIERKSLEVRNLRLLVRGKAVGLPNEVLEAHMDY